MTIKSRLSSWLRYGKSDELIDGSLPERREFVYLDEISVLSILSSRKGGIVTEVTEKQTTSLNSEAKGSLSVGLGGTNVNLGTNLQSGEVEAFQVSRKANIQSNFKELYDIEHSMLALSPTNPNVLPAVDSDHSLERLLSLPQGNGLLIDPDTLHRGDLLEFEVELEADSIFRMATIITTFFDLMQDNEELFQNAGTAQLPEIRSIARLLESLLAGLVPIRGRLVDYSWIRICDRDVLVHQSLLRQVPTDVRPRANPVFLVGVAQRDLFWKDIRRVLFSKARYTVFCRLATNGLTERWNPVKMADVFSGLSSDFEEMIQGLGDELMSEFGKGMRSANAGTTVDLTSTNLSEDVQYEEQLLRTFAESLAAHHNQSIDRATVEALPREISRPANWLDSVDGYRPVFAGVAKRMDDSLGVVTPLKVVSELRTQALCYLTYEATAESGASTVNSNHVKPRCERFLDSEIIAIYW